MKPTGDWSVVFRAAPPLWVTVLVIIPAILALTYLVYRRENVRPAIRYSLLFLRSILFIILVLILFQPVLSKEFIFRKESNLAVLIDDSLSMGFGASGDAKTSNNRIKQVEQALFSLPTNRPLSGTGNGQTPTMVNQLTDDYRVKFYTFSNDLKPLAIEVSPPGRGQDSKAITIEARGDSTAMGNAVLDVLRDLQGHTTGIVVISDGQNNAGIEPLEAVRILKERRTNCPVYTVAPRPTEIRDIELLDLKAPAVAIARDFVSFDFSLRATGFKEGEIVTVALLENTAFIDDALVVSGTGRTATEMLRENVILPAPGNKVDVSLKYRPTQPGKYVYTIKVPVQKDETIAENNLLTHYINVVEHTIKVLYVETYPRWEYRRLKNALIRDHSMKAAVLLLDADPEFPQESSPGVMPVYQFPQTKQDLFGYDVIIWGDVDPQRLGASPAISGQIIDNIKTFVEDMGGGIGFIAGAKYCPDSFRGTFMAELLPVTLEDQPYSLTALVRDEGGLKEAFKMKLTPDGREDPIMRLDPNQVFNQRLWEDADGLPGLIWFFPVRKAKPAARVLAFHPLSRNQSGERPVIAVQYYGKGRALFTAVDETWRWCLYQGDKYFYGFWGNTLRWLRGNQLLGSRRYQLSTDKPDYVLGEKVKIFGRVYDPEFNPVSAGTYPVKVTMPARPDVTSGRSGGPAVVSLPARGQESTELELSSTGTRAGAYQGIFTPVVPGSYYLTLGGNGDAEQSVISFRVSFPHREYENPGINVNLMQAIAEKAGGTFLYLDEISKLPKAIKPSADIITSETSEKELWDTPWVFLLFLCVITLEWVIRKAVRLL